MAFCLFCPRKMQTRVLSVRGLLLLTRPIATLPSRVPSAVCILFSLLLHLKSSPQSTTRHQRLWHPSQRGILSSSSRQRMSALHAVKLRLVLLRSQGDLGAFQAAASTPQVCWPLVAPRGPRSLCSFLQRLRGQQRERLYKPWCLGPFLRCASSCLCHEAFPSQRAVRLAWTL